jgi:hypothetical protein
VPDDHVWAGVAVGPGCVCGEGSEGVKLGIVKDVASVGFWDAGGGFFKGWFEDEARLAVEFDAVVFGSGLEDEDGEIGAEGFEGFDGCSEERGVGCFEGLKVAAMSCVGCSGCELYCSHLCGLRITCKEYMGHFSYSRYLFQLLSNCLDVFGKIEPMDDIKAVGVLINLKILFAQMPIGRSNNPRKGAGGRINETFSDSGPASNA